MSCAPYGPTCGEVETMSPSLMAAVAIAALVLAVVALVLVLA